MIDRQKLLSDLQSVLKRLEADLLERSVSSDVPEVGQTLLAEYGRAKKAERTAENYEDWRSGAITQTAAAWVLSCVFVRFLEDNRLIDPPKIAGPNERLQQARDEHELYFRAHPKETDREYLLSVFDSLAELPGTRDVFGPHNPLRELPNWLSGDAAAELLRFLQKIDANTGVLVHDFSCQSAVVSDQSDNTDNRQLTTHNYLDTRFLGDLYQDLSEAARKKYALLQTPKFVEEFILDRTLEPALDEFGLVVSGQSSVASGQSEEKTDNRQLTTGNFFKMIDPACGSGHFLLGAFRRILDRWQKREPRTNVRELVQRTLASIHGVDVNPYAVAIARFRLLLAAMRACGIQRLADAPGFKMNLACGDSLLHAPLRGGQHVFDFELTSEDADECEHVYQCEDLPALKRMLRAGQYHAVVANPPYITPKDRQLNERYRKRFESCHRQYSLAVPFMEMLFKLSVVRCQSSVRSGKEAASTDNPQPTTDNGKRAGFVGQITANSFMKREFGKKLIESFLPKVDLTHVIDTSGAYIPGHGTPTVILFGCNRAPVGSTIRAVMGIRGEPNTPDDPSQGLVWSAIINQIDEPGSQSDFVSVSDSEREGFHTHPWSIGGGGVAQLKQQLDESAHATLAELTSEIGFVVITGEDNVLLVKADVPRRHHLFHIRPLADGEVVRDWTAVTDLVTLWPNDVRGERLGLERLQEHLEYLWPYRTSLKDRKAFGIPVEQKRIPWWALREVYPSKLRTPLSIVFAFVATHNHFVLDRGGKVFNRSAPVIKLPTDACEDDHLALLGLLNSSTGCFWMKQVFHDKGSTVDSKGARQTTVAFENFREFTGTGLLKFPIPDKCPPELARQLDQLAQQLVLYSPESILTQRHKGAKEEPPSETAFALAPLREALSAARARQEELRNLLVFLQEELDWQCYGLYGLIDEDLTVPRRPREHPEEAERKNSAASVSAWCTPLGRRQRAFEIVMARKMAAGELQTTWFERHGTTPITELPPDLSDDYRQLVARRIEVIESHREIALIEQPEYKRRWNWLPWESQQQRALRQWLLNRLESYFDFDGRMDDVVSGHSSVDPEGQTTGAITFNFGGPDIVVSCEAERPLADIQLTTVAKLADAARQDPQFMEVGEVYRDDAAFDVQRLVEQLVQAESVPLLPILRYKPSGLRKRQEWETTWELQRREDELSRQLSVVSCQLDEATDKTEKQRLRMRLEELKTEHRQRTTAIPVPPKYKSSDFISTGGARYWALRGKLDVPKERWVSFPHCEGADGTLVIAWAGYDHLQLARAISAYYVTVQERLGGAGDPRLVPLLAGLLELLPWLKQWHNDVDPEYGVPMGDYFEGFLQEEARDLPRSDGGIGWTLEDIKAWQPPKKRSKRKSKVSE